MRPKLTIQIKRRTQTQWLCRVLLLLPFGFGVLTQLLQLPNGVKYTLDLIWLTLLLLLLMFRRRIAFRNVRLFATWAGLFFAYSLLAYLPHYQSGLFYLWGLRNNFRVYAAFLAFSVFLTASDAEDYFRLFDQLFWLNVTVSLVQYAVFGKSGDHLGGIFGTQKGCNGFTNIFLCIVVAKAVIFCLMKREQLSRCFLKVAAAMLVAALAELKFFFAEALLILLLAVCFTDFRWRKVLLILLGFGAVAAGALVLEQIFPDFSGFFSWKWMWETAASTRGYTSSGDLNRLNAISVINERFFGRWWERMFGLGLGNCETSAVSFLNTPFFRKHGHLHYSWMSHAFLYLECGWVGLVFYFGFFALVYYRTRYAERTCAAAAPYCKIARIMAVLCPLIAVYNSSLRTEAAYMVYFVLAVPFMDWECNIKNKVERK